MSETPVVQDPQPVVVPDTPKEFRYEFQPTDENGASLGGKQVIVYDGTPEDLGKKMSAQNTELIRMSRKLKRDLHLSGATRDSIPETAKRFDASKYELKPEPLTAEERIQLAQDMQDPEKLDFVADRLVRSKIGDPDALRTRLARVEQQMDRSNVQEEAKAFMRQRPEYFPHPENLKTLAAWIEKYELDPIVENFVLAYDTLKEFLIPRPAPAPVSVQPEPTPVATPTPAPAPRPVSTGLTRSNASDSGPVTSDNMAAFRAEINRMPGDEYKKRFLHEKGFKEKVEAMDRADAERRQARQ